MILSANYFYIKKTFFVFPSVYMDKAVNNSYPNQNLVKVKTINFLTFFIFPKIPNIWINIQKQTDLSVLLIFYVLFF